MYHTHCNIEMLFDSNTEASEQYFVFNVVLSNEIHTLEVCYACDEWAYEDACAEYLAYAREYFTVEY